MLHVYDCYVGPGFRWHETFWCLQWKDLEFHIYLFFPDLGVNEVGRDLFLVRQLDLILGWDDVVALEMRAGITERLRGSLG